MKRFFLNILAISLILACSKEEGAQNQSTPEPPKDNVEENYTPEISTDENGYDGLKATDLTSDSIVSGDETYWENSKFDTKVTVVYS